VDRDLGSQVVQPNRAGVCPAGELARADTFEAFYRREMAGLVGLARVLCGSWAVAEDLAQEAMLVAYRRWDEVSHLDVPLAWVRKVCANQATSAIRRRTVEARALVRLGSRRQIPEPAPLENEVFWSEVRRLPRRQAQSIALHYVYDMGVVEIAATLGCSDSSVKAHLVRGRAALARRLGADVVEEPS
jgi:RNA polymerase sigma factor (sigma-70 family)